MKRRNGLGYEPRLAHPRRVQTCGEAGFTRVALASYPFGILEEPFQHLNGNVQGYAKAGGVVAINPAVQLPHKTLFHELGHQVLGHLSVGERSETETLPRNLEEAETEGVALICCEAQDKERLARFEREAQLLASLNHPNIASIYGIENADGVKALVLELVEGPTLAERIAEGPDSRRRSHRHREADRGRSRGGPR